MQLSIVSRMRKEPPSRFSHLLGRYLNVESIRTQNAWETALKLRRGKDVLNHLAAITGRGGAGGAASPPASPRANGAASPPPSPRAGGGGGGGGGGP